MGRDRSARRPAQGAERTEAVLGRWRRGDKEAKRRLFFKLRRFLIERAQASPTWPALRTRETPEDVAHDLLVSLFKRERFATFEDRGEGSLRAWLDCCLQQHMVDLVRRQSTLRRGEGRAPLPLEGGESRGGANAAVSPDAGASSMFCYAEWKERLTAVLPRRERIVWELRTDQGHEFRGIGEALGITPESARGLFFRARKRLRERGLGDGGFEDGGGCA